MKGIVTQVDPSETSRCVESGQRIAIKHFGLPRVSVPLSVSIAQHLRRHDDAKAEDAVILHDSIVDNLAIGPDGELQSASQFSIAQHPHFILAWILVQVIPGVRLMVSSESKDISELEFSPYRTGFVFLDWPN